MFNNCVSNDAPEKELQSKRSWRNFLTEFSQWHIALAYKGKIVFINGQRWRQALQVAVGKSLLRGGAALQLVKRVKL